MTVEASASSARPAGIRPAARYLPEVDALRGLGVALIVASHIANTLAGGGDAREASPLAAYIWAGHTGLTLLFVLSGFLLALPFLDQLRGGPVVSRPNFYLRRALRILPLYYLCVVVGTALSARDVLDVGRGIPYLFFLNAFAGITRPLFPYSAGWWSLETEVEFILLLPLIPLLGVSKVGRRVAVAIVYVYAIAMVAFLLGRFGMGSIEGQLKLASSIFGRGYLFLFGILTAWVYLRYAERLRAWADRTRMVRAGGTDVALLAALIALSFLLRWSASIGALRGETAPYHLWHLPEGLLWTCVLMLVLLLPLRVRPLLVNRVFIGLGLIAYSLYMIHNPLILRAWVIQQHHRGMGAP